MLSPDPVYYLAQSKKDLGRFAEAADLYARRATMGSWEEERWHAMLSQSRCVRMMGE
jgi:hypothetical protein